MFSAIGYKLIEPKKQLTKDINVYFKDINPGAEEDDINEKQKRRHTLSLHKKQQKKPEKKGCCG